MALKLELKPHERFILGTAVVTNGDMRTTLFIEGQAPVLREKDILTPDSASSPAKKIYLAIQLMYLDEDVAGHQKTYFKLVDDFIEAAPSALSLVDEINNQILTGNLYKALRHAKRLIDYERELIGHADISGPGLSTDGAQGRQPA